MQNAECEMQNCGVRFADRFQSFPKEIPSFCILHSSFCIHSPILINGVLINESTIHPTILYRKKITVNRGEYSQNVSFFQVENNSVFAT